MSIPFSSHGPQKMGRREALKLLGGGLTLILARPLRSLAQPIEKTHPLADGPSTSFMPPKMEIKINLPEFTLRYFENGIQVDSARIACGQHASPIISVQQNEITYRPSFNPTKDEKRAKKPLKPAPPEHGNAPDKPHNPLGRRRIVIFSTYRMHGTAWPESMGHAASNGCIRVENIPIERITDTMVLHATGKPAQDKPGWQHTYHLPVPFSIQVAYCLWTNLQVSSSILAFRAWPDIHHRLSGGPKNRKARRCPVDDGVPGNGYLLTHLLAALPAVGVSLKPGLNENSVEVQKFWTEVKSELEHNRKKRALMLFSLSSSVFEVSTTPLLERLTPAPSPY